MLEIYLIIAVIVFITRVLDILAMSHSTTPMAHTIGWRIVRALIWPLSILVFIMAWLKGKR